MARFYFHVHNDVVTIDEQGLDMSGPAAAREQAIIEARELACETVRKGYLQLSHRIEVVDESGKRIANVTMRDAIEVDD